MVPAPDALSYTTVGTARKIGNNQVHVSELPVGMWTQQFKETLQVRTLLQHRYRQNVEQVVRDIVSGEILITLSAMR